MSMFYQTEFTTPSHALETSSQESMWSRLFWMMLLAHFVAWFIGPMVTMPTAPLDCIEKIALGLQWQWGYSKHPPLTHWLSTAAFLVTGSPKWPLLLMAQIAVSSCFIAIWQFSKRFIPLWAAFAAVFCLEGIYYFTFATPQFNENIILLPLWSWCALFFYDGMTKQSLSAWIIAGVLAGFACIAKYETVVFLLTLFIFLLSNPQARQSWRRPGVYLALMTGLLITLPNLLWLIQHHFLPIHYALNKSGKIALASNSHAHLAKIIQPFVDLITQIATVIPALLLLIPFYRNRQTPQPSFHGEYLKFLALGPATITFSMAILTGAHIYALWGIPFFIWIGAWLLVHWNPRYSVKSSNLFLIAMLIVASLMIVGRSVQLIYGPSWNGRITYQHYPAKQLAKAVSSFWRSEQQGSIPVIAGSSRAVQSIVAYSKAPYPTPYIEWDDETNAWVNTDIVQKRGGVFVFQMTDPNMTDFPKEIRARFPHLGPAQKIILPYQTRAQVKPLEVLMAILPETP